MALPSNKAFAAKANQTAKRDALSVNLILIIFSSVTWKAFCIFGENDIELLQIAASDISDTEIIPIELEDLESLKASFHNVAHRLTLSSFFQLADKKVRSKQH